MRKHIFTMVVLLLGPFDVHALDRVTILENQVQLLMQQLQAVQSELKDLHEKQGVEQEQRGELKEDLLVLQEMQDIEAEKAEDKVNLNMYTTLAYQNFDNSNSAFDATRVELLIDANIGERLHAGTEIEFERTAITSGGPRAGEVEVEQAWLQYDVNQAFNPRAGVILVPFGKYNLEHFDIKRDLTDRPLVMRRVVPATWADAGIGATGKFLLGNSRIDYQAYLVNGLTDIISDNGLRDGRSSFGEDNNDNQAFVGRLAYVSDVLEFGLSSYYGKYNDEKSITGVDLNWEYRHGDLELIGEYAYFDLEEGVNADGVAVPGFLKGGYIQLNHHFWADFLNQTVLGRSFSSPTFTGVIRYDRVENDDDGDIGIGNNEEQRWTIGLNYRPVESFAVKCEYQFNRSRNEALERGDKDGVLCSVTAAF